MRGCPRHGNRGALANSAGGQGIAISVAITIRLTLTISHTLAISHTFADAKGDATEAGSSVDHAARRKR